jgi:hypothetical protein
MNNRQEVNNDTSVEDELVTRLENLTIRFNEESAVILEELGKLQRLRQQREHRNRQRRRPREQGNNPSHNFPIGDIVEIRNRYKGDYGNSAFGIRGEVTEVTAKRVHLINRATNRRYTRAPQNIIKIEEQVKWR